MLAVTEIVDIVFRLFAVGLLQHSTTGVVISDFSKSTAPIIMDQWVPVSTDYGAAFLRIFISSCARMLPRLTYYITLISGHKLK